MNPRLLSFRVFGFGGSDESDRSNEERRFADSRVRHASATRKVKSTERAVRLVTTSPRIARALGSRNTAAHLARDVEMLARPHAPRLAGVEVRASTAPTRRASSPRFASSHAGGLRSRGRRATRRASLTSPRAAGDGESFLDKINPFKKSKSAELAKREADASALINDETRKQLFGDGLMGKMVSGVINQAASGLKEQMSAAAEATEVTYDSAVRACKMDGRVRSALGDDVQATPPMSQMSSSTNVNGVASQQTSVGFLLQSSTGRRAQVQAVSTTTNGVVTVDATVVTETGEQFVIRDCGGGDDVWASDGGGAGGARQTSVPSPFARGTTIDVDADDVIDV